MILRYIRESNEEFTNGKTYIASEGHTYLVVHTDKDEREVFTKRPDLAGKSFRDWFEEVAEDAGK